MRTAVQGMVIPIVLSRIMRAKQWSLWTGHLDYGGFNVNKRVGKKVDG